VTAVDMLASRRDCAAVVNQSEDESQLSGFEPALSQPHARPVSIRELDAGTRQHCFNYGKTLGVAGIPADFDIVDCISVKPCRFGQVPHSPIQGGSSHPYLCTCHRHMIVLLSHVPLTQP
jgi:hypothetical protein